MPKDFYENVKLPRGFDKKLIESAYNFAERAHQGQMRKSGDPYITHPVAVAKTLLELGMDAQTIASAILHDTIEDTGATQKEIEEKFGSAVARLVAGVTSLGKVDFSAYSTAEEKEVALVQLKNENLRQLFLAMAEDVRVVVIKLADRLHNMQTIKALSKDDQIRVAKETLNIFSPLALRLGMGEIKGEIEDLAFPIAYPDEYKFLKSEANRRYKAADRYVLHIKRIIADKLKEEKIKAEIEGRSKHIYSLYKKITRPEINWDFDKIYDLVALRIITDTVEDCYRILGIIHSSYRPLPNYIRDYIAAPKPNGYRSIHTSVFGPDAKIIEVQIRTLDMHHEAELGVASHLHYTEQKNAGASDAKLSKGTFGRKDQTEFLKRIKEWQEGNANSDDFVEGLKIEFLDDRIYVFSPLGDIYDLPVGATPVDFAFEVHSNVGNTCRGSKVNGKIVPLDHKLQTRDIVEIIVKKDAAPKRDWLDFVKTSRARQHIRTYYRQFDHVKNRDDGEKIVTSELALLGIDLTKVTRGEIKNALSETSFNNINDLYASVGGGLTTARQAVKMILGRSFIPIPLREEKKTTKTKGVAISTRMKATPAVCCNPGPHDDIICYITRGKGLTAHKKRCSNIKSLEPERLVKYNPWAKENILVELEITGKNRVGLIRDVTGVISENNINIEKFKDTHRKSSINSILYVTVVVSDLSDLTDLIKKVKRIKDIVSVKRM